MPVQEQSITKALMLQFFNVFHYQNSPSRQIPPLQNQNYSWVERRRYRQTQELNSKSNMALLIQSQYPQKQNVCEGIFSNCLIGPFFLEANLNGARYFNLLDNQVMPSIDKKLCLILWNRVVFQQYWIPPHCVVHCDTSSIITF